MKIVCIPLHLKEVQQNTQCSQFRSASEMVLVLETGGAHSIDIFQICIRHFDYRLRDNSKIVIHELLI